MKGHIKLIEALIRLNNKYCEKYDNANVEFGLEKHSYTYTDWGGFTETEYFYALYAIINYEKTIGSVTFSDYVKKDFRELNYDLIEELNKEYETKGYKVSSISLPTYRGKKYNEDDDVLIWVYKRKNKVLAKK